MKQMLPRPGEEILLRSILDTVPEGMIVIDEGGQIVYFSAAAERMFGYREQDVVGENVSTLMPSPDREKHDGYLANYMQTGERRMIGIGRITTARRRDAPLSRSNSPSAKRSMEAAGCSPASSAI